jgi:hypothetical protein
MATEARQRGGPTPTLKLKRHAVKERGAGLFGETYR